MAATYKLENDGQLLLVRLDQEVDARGLGELFGTLENYLKGGVGQILVLRREADAAFEFDTSLEFGEKFGDLLSGTDVVVASVGGGESRKDVAINAVVFSKGVAIGEFETEREARGWLKDKDYGIIDTSAVQNSRKAIR